MIPKNTWVEVELVVLNKEDRAENLPRDTASTDMKQWSRGFTLEEGEIGSEMIIKTITGRYVKGKVTEIEPRYKHDFGDFVPEVATAGVEALEMLFPLEKGVN